jgi:hypothetical protein
MFTKIQSLYLSWVNDFISVARFAEYYEISEEYAYKLIRVGREVHERHVSKVLSDKTKTHNEDMKLLQALGLI